ncbi:NUDIX hydrolase [Rikenella microfusus]|uniref:Nudix hydrolase domain-containing protein n=1 Tax=Rikenella microfusus TaxID=28139 RepID=A0A379MPE3_9BACT|nr:NUDIX domain-containing protein [Rikenella microfusus]SUE33395.1 Uncharacterised protein [Rikenella microfusus]
MSDITTMPFTYAIVHDGARCLIFKKKKHGHFFQRQAVNPKADLHGGGKYCFPGGSQTEANPIIGARREFREETGIVVPTDVIREWKFTEGDGTGCCFEIPADALTALHASVSRQLEMANSDDWTNEDCKVQDNELKNPELVPLANLPGDYFRADDKDTGWFHSFVTRLKAELEK